MGGLAEARGKKIKKQVANSDCVLGAVAPWRKCSMAWNARACVDCCRTLIETLGGEVYIRSRGGLSSKGTLASA